MKIRFSEIERYVWPGLYEVHRLEGVALKVGIGIIGFSASSPIAPRAIAVSGGAKAAIARVLAMSLRNRAFTPRTRWPLSALGLKKETHDA